MQSTWTVAFVNQISGFDWQSKPSVLPRPNKGATLLVHGREEEVCPPFPVGIPTQVAIPWEMKKSGLSVLYLFVTLFSKMKLRLQLEHGKLELGHVVQWPAAGRLGMRQKG